MAKLRFDQLAKSLGQKLAPIYLVTGDETLLVQEASDLIRQAAKKAGFGERELHQTDAGFQWDYLNHSANSMSLFAQKKIIEVRIHNGKPGDAGSKALIEYCQAINEDNLLLLVLPKLDKRSQNAKWFKTLDQHADIVTIWPIGIQQLPRWIEQRLAKVDLFADKEAIDILCSKVEGNLLAAAQEIEKLKLIVADSQVSAEIMADVITDSARYDVFGLVDKAIAGDSRAATSNLQGLKAEGTETTLILWALAREIRAIVAIKEGMENGKSFDLLARQHGVWENRKGIIKNCVYRSSLTQLHMLVRKSSRADSVIKGSNKGDIWSLLLDIVLSLSGIEALSSKSLKLSLRA